MTTRTKLHAVAALALLGGALAVATTPAPASAWTGCTTKVITTTDGFTVTGGASVALLPEGVKMTTPEQPSKVDYAAPVKTPLGQVTKASYQTQKLDPGSNPRTRDALPAYRLAIDVDDNGTTDTTAVYEPYWQPAGTVNTPPYGPTPWDVTKGVFWLSKPAGGLAAAPGGPGTYTLAALHKAWPDAVVTAYGVGQGTYNEGTIASVNHVQFGTPRSCLIRDFKAPATTPTASPTATPTSSPTASPTSTATASPTATATASPTSTTTASPTPTGTATASPTRTTAAPTTSAPTLVPVADTGSSSTGGALPTTGAPIPLIAGGAVALLAAGVGITVAARRRRTHFEA